MTIADDIILHIENPKHTTTKLLKLKNSVNLQNTKISAQKYVTFLITKYQIEIKKMIFYNCTKNI